MTKTEFDIKQKIITDTANIARNHNKHNAYGVSALDVFMDIYTKIINDACIARSVIDALTEIHAAITAELGDDFAVEEIPDELQLLTADIQQAVRELQSIDN